jgi:hypothetical protein
MKIKSLLLAALVATSTAAFAAETAPLTLNGVLTMSNAQHFGLVNEGATRTGWVKLGDDFDGYLLKSYDSAAKTLTLEKGGKAYAVVLADSKFDGSAKTPAGTKATLADAEEVFAAMQLEDMLTKTLEKQLAAQQKMMSGEMEKRLGGKVDEADLAAFQKKMLDAMIEAINPEQMKKDMVQLYAENFTKEELSAMAAFNSTPAGKAMMAKQPAIQGRIQELMMPRMMSVMPKIGQMGKEFNDQQKAKIQAKTEQATTAVPATTDAVPAAGK